VVAFLGVFVFLLYRCYMKKLLARDSLILVAWGALTMAVAYPGRQLLFDAGVLSK
jgi:hypothetical protein